MANKSGNNNHSQDKHPYRFYWLTAGLTAIIVAIIGFSIKLSSTGSGTASGSQSTASAGVFPSSYSNSPSPTSSPSPVASTSASATPAAATARTIATFSGSGQENTPKFTVTETWKLVYSFNCSSFGIKGNFQVYEDGGNDFNLSVNDLAMSKSSSTWAYNDGGTHYLQINSECSWKVKVVDES